MEIKDIKLSKDKEFLIEWKDLSANVCDDTRFFWAESFDGQDACSGMIVDAFENVNNENPTLCVMRVYKISQTVFKFQEPVFKFQEPEPDNDKLVQEFYGSEDWEVREDTDNEYILEQKNCLKNSQEICRDFRILGAEKRQDEPGVNGEVWMLYRALDDGRGIHSRKELIIVRGTKEDAIDELNRYRD